MRQAKQLNQKRQKLISLAWMLRVAGGLGIMCAIVLSPSVGNAFFNQDKIDTVKAMSHYMVGHRYDLLGEVEKAAFEYEKAAQFDPASYLIHLRLGADYARLNLLDKSIQELNLVSQYNPEELQSHYLLALIYSTQKEYDKAAEEYEIILKSFSEAEPQNIEIYGYLGQLYYSQKKYAQAIEQFEKILILEPINADVMYLLGSLYVEVDDKHKAVDVLKRSINLDSRHDGSLNTLGYLYAEMDKNLDEAMELVERALEIRPGNGAYLDSLGWVQYKKKKYKKALKLFIEADKVLKDPVIYEHLGDVYLKLNDVEKAVKNWEHSLELLAGQIDVIDKINKAKSAQAKN